MACTKNPDSEVLTPNAHLNESRIKQKEKNSTDNGNSGAAPASGSNPDGGDASGSGGGEETELNPAERSLLQKVSY